ncbi:HET-domain-containing protein [Echria macrotheca]|uniref:HET-domain-containing protein n=1 Tax=Echria macrotheca TaxID=438768 RepID=A0AAJ0F529_9PEZI|nr:HET-domain-containing protein [Echria macrotheca]
MRLVNAQTLRLKEFLGIHVPRYAILSHTWGPDEVTFQMLESLDPGVERMAGYAKIRGAAMRALRDGFAYVWVDTCCIDKTSSAELSEAINSMFNWYRDASICYAYLEDVPRGTGCLADIRNGWELTDPELDEVLRSEFAKSRWFTRGWTLQEFIAPFEVKFYNREWEFIGAKQQLAGILSVVTGVDEEIVLHQRSLSEVCAARKLSWAARRQTTRIEDIAYCLLGLFDIQMPLLYGEGEKSFIRLQEEIIKVSDDQSLFAWSNADANEQSLFAPSPDRFQNAGKIVRWKIMGGNEPWALTNYGLRMWLPLIRNRAGEDHAHHMAVLACRYEDDFTGPIGLLLRATDDPTVFEPPFYPRTAIVELEKTTMAEMTSLYVLTRRGNTGWIPDLDRAPENLKCWVRVGKPAGWEDFHVREAFPPRCWNPKAMTMWARRGNTVKAALHLLNGGGEEIVLAFGYVRTGTRAGRTSYSSEWVRLAHYEEDKSLEQMCDKASSVAPSELSSESAQTLVHLGESWHATAAMRSEVVMGEMIYVVDLKISRLEDTGAHAEPGGSRSTE